MLPQGASVRISEKSFIERTSVGNPERTIEGLREELLENSQIRGRFPEGTTVDSQKDPDTFQCNGNSFLWTNYVCNRI